MTEKGVRLYSHFPCISLVVEIMVAAYILVEIVEVLQIHPLPILGMICYVFFFVIAGILVFFTDWVQVYQLSDSSILVRKRPFPFLSLEEVRLMSPVEAQVSKKSAGRASLVKICLKNGESIVPLTRARTLHPDAASKLVGHLNDTFVTKNKITK